MSNGFLTIGNSAFINSRWHDHDIGLPPSWKLLATPGNFRYAWKLLESPGCWKKITNSPEHLVELISMFQRFVLESFTADKMEFAFLYVSA